MKPLLLLSWIILLIQLTGCSTMKPKVLQAETVLQLEHSYSYQIIRSSSNTPISLKKLAKQLKDYDVIFIGEYHGNHASHLLQAQLQSQLYKLRPNQILTLEQFNSDKQEILNAYLDSEIGEKIFMKQADAWKNYIASYRPLIEFAKRKVLPVYATNAPSSVVRCVGRHGKDYITDKVRDLYPTLPNQPFMNNLDYQEKFKQFVKKSATKNRPMENTYFAQLLRDNSMAENILKAHLENPTAQIIHLNGTFHSEEHLGTVALLQQRKPKLKIAVISPIHLKKVNEKLNSAQLKKGDFVYLVQQQPSQFVVSENRKKAMQAMFKKSKSHPCH